ncbi:MAG: DNA-3-methyladenine glycosylase family protein [Hyphomicrobiaceae bacterium]
MGQRALIIETDGDVMRGVRHLRKRCAFMREAHDLTGAPPLRRGAGGYEGLMRIIVGQQVSVASATAIWARVQKTLKPLEPENILRRRETTLRKAGLSGPKIRTLRAVSQAVMDGRIDFSSLGTMQADDIRETLIAVHGIGPWTADIYVMFCLGHADAWASGDLALQIAAERLMELDARPSADELTEIAERWRPWRSVAARLLWAYYAKSRAMADAVPV